MQTTTQRNQNNLTIEISPMYFNKKIKKITINDDGLLISYKTGSKNKILFSELKDIFITVNKINPIYEFLIAMFSAIVALFIFFYLQADPILIISFLLIITIMVKMTNYKRYGVQIKLKNGISIKKQVPLKSKNDTVDFVNDVRRKVYNNKIETSNKLHGNV